MPDPKPDAPLPDWILRCPVCCREAVYSERALLDSMWGGWPQCCGRDVILLPDDGSPPINVDPP